MFSPMESDVCFQSIDFFFSQQCILRGGDIPIDSRPEVFNLISPILTSPKCQ